MTSRSKSSHNILFLSGLFALFLAGNPAWAEAERTFTIGGGYREDYLNWHIADVDGSPNILSELTWEDVEIYQIQAEWEGIADNGAYFQFSLGYGLIQDGVSRDSDYLFDDRNGEFSRSYSDVTGDDVLDAKLTIGKELILDEASRLRVIPLLGYGYNEQNFRDKHGDQIIPDLGPFPGLNSTYRADWSGPFLGFDLRYGQEKDSMLFARAEWHWAKYDAKANWNLRDDLDHPVSFLHQADGRGSVYSLGWRGALSRGWALGVVAEFQYWLTGSGDDVVFFADGSAIATRLNEVTWKSKAISVTLDVDL